MTTSYTEYGGFVKNLDTEQYEQMFVTSCSELLCIGRAKEKAENYNTYTDKHYDTNDIIIKKRQCVLEQGDWEEIKE